MSTWETVKSFFTPADNYGTAVNLNYFKSTNKHKSCCGGLTTMLGFGFLFAYAMFSGV